MKDDIVLELEGKKVGAVTVRSEVETTDEMFPKPSA